MGMALYVGLILRVIAITLRHQLAGILPGRKDRKDRKDLREDSTGLPAGGRETLPVLWKIATTLVQISCG